MSDPMPEHPEGGLASDQPVSPTAAMSRRSLLMICGGVIAGTIGGAGMPVFTAENGGGAAALLDTVAIESLPQLETTLSPNHAAHLLEEARRCREPLAHVAVWHRSGRRGGMVAIVSGRYRSPTFELSTVPSRIALPFPAPYPSGRGVLGLVGEADDLVIRLHPGTSMTLNGHTLIPVWWRPLRTCA